MERTSNNSRRYKDIVSIDFFHKVLSKFYTVSINYNILNYQIDIYVYVIKLGIICDEDTTELTDKEKEISQLTNCSFFKYNPNNINYFLHSVMTNMTDRCFTTKYQKHSFLKSIDHLF